MSKFKWLITNALLRHGNEAKNRKLLLFYLFIARTAPDSSKFDYNSTPGSSMNFHLVDISTKSCISQIISLTFLTQRHTEFHLLSLREVGTKGRL